MYGLKHSIIGPTPRPEPPQGTDMLIPLALAMAYLAFLILVKGIEPDTAFGMASRKYGISEDTLHKASKGRLWE